MIFSQDYKCAVEPMEALANIFDFSKNTIEKSIKTTYNKVN